MSNDEFNTVRTIPRMPDVILQILMNINRQDERNSMSITVLAGGKVVTGTVVHRNAWLERLRELMPHEQSAKMIEDIDIAIRGLEAEVEEQTQDDDDLPPASFLHFLNAEIDGAPVDLFRLFLGTVDGWSLGYRR